MSNELASQQQQENDNSNDSDDSDSFMITDGEKLESILKSLLGQICYILHPQAGRFVGNLQTDGTGFGFNGSIGFLPNAIEKIYPISVPTEKNEARGVIYLKSA